MFFRFPVGRKREVIESDLLRWRGATVGRARGYEFVPHTHRGCADACAQPAAPGSGREGNPPQEKPLPPKWGRWRKGHPVTWRKTSSGARRGQKQIRLGRGREERTPRDRDREREATSRDDQLLSGRA